MDRKNEGTDNLGKGAESVLIVALGLEAVALDRLILS
jgi:hypothetical protein